MMNQSAIQLSIIAFQNDDKDELFNFYDKRGKKRIMKVRKEMEEINTSIQSNSSQLLGSIEKLRNIFDIPALSRPEGNNTGSDI